jgi:HSP20 family protein
MSQKKLEKLKQLNLVSPFGEELDFFFSSFFGSPYPSLYRKELCWQPPTDFYETESDYVVILELAQVKQKDVSITFQKGILSVRGIRKAEPPSERRKYHKMEINYGPFEQKIMIPDDIESEKLTAHYEDGFIEIHLPKKQTSSRNVIDIKVE